MTSTKTGLPFIRYARVSRVGGRSGEGYISIPEQVRTMDGKAGEMRVAVYPDVFQDSDKSGGNMDRDEFQRALGLIRDGEAAGIIVATLDRFSRDVPDALGTIREIEQLGGRLLCGDGDVSVANGTDAFMATVRLAVGAFERSRRAEYLDKSVRNAIERGVHLSAPFGYRKSNGKGSRLAVHPDEAPLVRTMFEARAAGHSWPAVAAMANEVGPAPRPHKRDGITRQASWTHKTVRQIVMSEVYVGVAFNGKRRHEHAHDAVVTAETFAAANRARGTKPVGPKDGYLLTGLVRCAQCGYVMVNQAGRTTRSYRCRNAQGGDCAGTTVPAEPLEQLVAQEFVRRYLDVELEVVASDGRVIEVEGELARAESRLAGLFEAMGTLGEMSASERKIFEGRLAAGRKALAETEAELATARMSAIGADLPADLDEAKFTSSTVGDQRQLLGFVFAAVAVRPGRGWREAVGQRVQVVGRDEAPTDGTRLIAHVAGLDWH